MATDLEKLVVSLEAKITSYEKAMQKAVGISNQRAKQVESRWAKVNLGSNAFAGFAKGAVAGLAPVVSIAAAIEQVKAALKSFGAINDASVRGGLDPEVFQAIVIQAKAIGVEMDGAADAVATFNKLSAQATENRGKLVAGLKGEHPELLKSLQLATDQEQRYRLIVDAIKNAKTQSEALVIATAAFGDNGTKLLDALRGGSAALDDIKTKGKDAGSIVDRELVQRADDLGDKLDASAGIVDIQLKRAFINLAPYMVTTVDLAGQLLKALNDASSVKVINDPSIAHYTQLLSDAEKQAEPLRQQVADIKADIAALADDNAFKDSLKFQLIDPQAELARIDLVIANLKARLAELGVSPGGATLEASGSAPTNPGVHGTVTKEDLDQSHSVHVAAASAAESHAQAVRDLIASLQFEQAQIGRTALEQKVMNALHSAGVDAASAEGQAIRKLITDNEALQKRVDDNAAAVQGLNDAATTAAEALVDAFSDGKIEAGELLDIVKNLAIELIKSGALTQLLGSFKGASVFSGATATVSAHNAGGTDNWRGGLTHINEAGGEIIDLPRGTRIIPHDLSKKMMGAGSGVSIKNETRIINNAGVKVTQQETDTPGGRRQDIILDEMVASAIARPRSASQRAIGGIGRSPNR